MKHIYLLFALSAGTMSQLYAQSYFPPNGSQTWETVSTDELGWCQDAIDSLNNFLETRHTKGFIILEGGRIAMESYYNGHSATLPWYWASAGKSLASVLVGAAQEDGLLSIEAPSNTYLPTGWTDCSLEEETLRTVRHHLSLTTSFSNLPFLWDCTLPECFLCNDLMPGEQWHYHNGVYKMVHDIIENATGETSTAYTNTRVGSIIGMTGFWNADRLFWSNTRAMARFGLLSLNNYIWNGTDVLTDTDYILAMKTPSNPHNPSYGYLWWLNGQSSHMLPLDQTSYGGPIIPNAPADMYAGMGANDQRVYVIPSQDMVVVRMGEEAYENAPALSAFDHELWALINALPCQVTNTTERKAGVMSLRCFPNPSSGEINIIDQKSYQEIRIFDAIGQEVGSFDPRRQGGVPSLPSGVYFLQGTGLDNSTHTGKVIIL